MKLPLTRRITSERVPKDQRSTIDNISYIVNPFMEDVTTLVNGRIDFTDNLVSKVIQVDVMVDSNGVPIGELLINTQMVRYPRGTICINVQGAEPSERVDIAGTPFLMTNVQPNGLVKVTKVLNLIPNVKYKLTVLFV